MSRETNSNSGEKTVSLLGCGWLGIALANALLLRGCFVRGSTTHPSRVSLLSSMGIEPLLLRIEPAVAGTIFSSGSADQFFSSSCLVIDMPPETAMGADYHPAQIEAILSMIGESAKARPEQILYVSSTAVYGASQGLVDEKSVPQPDQGSGAILLAAEERLASYARETGIGLTIVRPGGFIGPGKHPGLFLAGRRDVANGSTPVNMIHQLDLCDLIAALIVDHPAAAGSVEIYNAVSSHHPLRSDYYARASSAIGVEPPTFASPLAPPSGEAKIVSSDKIRRVTGCVLRYDDLYSAIGAGSATVTS